MMIVNIVNVKPSEEIIREVVKATTPKQADEMDYIRAILNWLDRQYEKKHE